MSEGKGLRLLYLGTPDFAVEPLKRLVEEGYNVVAVVTMPDKPAGRGQKLKGSAVKEYALSVGLPILQPEKLSDPTFIEELSTLELDLGIVVAFKMLPRAVWSLPRLGTLNLHGSLLPDYRGAAPINWAVINGDKVTGVTTFMLKHEIDTGDVIARSEAEITDIDNAGTLHDKLMYIGGALVLESVDKVADSNFIPTPQSDISESQCRPAPKIFKEDCKLDFTMSALSLHNKVRGLSPYPAAWMDLEGDSFKVFSSDYELNSNAVIGSVVTDNKNYLKIGCSDGYLVINELQLAGKRRMAVDELLRGYNIEKK